MKLKSLLKVVEKDTFLVFETNIYSSLGGCYKDDFKKTFRNHPYLDLDISEIRASKTRQVFSDKLEDCLLITFRG